MKGWVYKIPDRDPTWFEISPDQLAELDMMVVDVLSTDAARAMFERRTDHEDALQMALWRLGQSVAAASEWRNRPAETGRPAAKGTATS